MNTIELVSQWAAKAKAELDIIKANPLSTPQQINNAEYNYAHHVTRLHHISGQY